jgi:uncharacterized peroxidase-related enzyme
MILTKIQCIDQYQEERIMAKFNFYTPENTTGHTKELLEGLKQSYGFIPNLFAYMAEAPLTIEAYLALNDLVSKTSFSPAQQQVALLAVSVENGCSFCSVAHRAVGKMQGANPQTLAAINAKEPVHNPEDAALVNFTQSVVRSRGWPTESEIQAFLDAGFTRQQIMEVILIVSIKTLSNYINHLTQPEPNKELLSMI